MGGSGVEFFWAADFPLKIKGFFSFNNGPDLYNLDVDKSEMGNPEK